MIIIEIACIIVILFCILTIIKKNYLVNILLSLGLTPFIFCLFLIIDAAFHGTGLSNKGGFDSLVLAIMACLLRYWYLLIGAGILLFYTIRMMKKDKKKRNLNIYDKTCITSLIITSLVVGINALFASMFYKVLFMYRPIDKANNIYYGIGFTLERTEKQMLSGVTMIVDFPSIIGLLVISLLICFIIFKITDKKHK